MRKLYKNKLCFLLLASLLCGCGQKGTDELLEFQSTKHDNSVYIVCGEIEYQYYGLPDQADMGERLGSLDGNENDGIYSFRDFPTEDFIVEYLYSGLMDSPVLYRAIGCATEPEGVYVFEEAGLTDITWLVDDYQVIQDEQNNDIGYLAGGQTYNNYFAVDDGHDRFYIALSNRNTLTLEEILGSMAGETDYADILVVGYYIK